MKHTGSKILSMFLAFCMVLTLLGGVGIPAQASGEDAALYVDASYAGGDSDGSEEKPYATLHAAIAAAEAGDTVRLLSAVERIRSLR